MRIATEHPYVSRVRRAKELFDRNRADPAPLFDLHAEDVVLHAPGTSPLGGGVRGRANGFARLKRMAELSGGNRQRVNIAIGLIADPAVLLLDEPSTALDPRQRERLWEFVGGLTARGTSIVYSTHIVQEAERYADRVLAFYQGRILADGEPHHVLRDQEVRRYVTGGAP